MGAQADDAARTRLHDLLHLWVGQRRGCYENRSFVPIGVDRGALVDPEALAAALNEGRLGGAGLDVFEPEILPGDSPLRTAANILLTSHTAWYSEDSVQDARVEAVESVIEGLGE